MKVLSATIPIAVFALVLAGASSPAGCGGGASTEVMALAHGGPGPNPGPGEETSGRLRARLIGFEETPAVSTTGRGTFQAFLSDDGTTFSFELTYADLEGNAGEGGAVTGAHIHFGQRDVAGGISVHLCGTGGRPACPAPPATVTGTFTADDVVGPTPQGITTGELDELIRAARADVTYVNVHTTGFPNGEIRGQIRATGFRHGGRDGEDIE